jgi:hypothetical protein
MQWGYISRHQDGPVVGAVRFWLSRGSKWGSFRPGPNPKPSGAKKADSSGRAKRTKDSGQAKGSKQGGTESGGSGGPSGGSFDFIQGALLLAIILGYNYLSSAGGSGTYAEAIDFQTFRNDVLARDLVDKVCIACPPGYDLALHKPLLRSISVTC